jgi:hemolysin activation/secretion protein
LRASAAWAGKTISKNPKINPLLYQDVVLKSDEFEGNCDLHVYIPVAQRFVFKIRGQAGSVTGAKLYENELFRMGGLKTIRGFDEASLTMNSYGVASAEFRFLFDKNSNVFVFYDKALYRKNTYEIQFTDDPQSAGLGAEFETKAGIFSVVYAVGQQFGNPIALRTAKIHFGFTNRF